LQATSDFADKIFIRLRQLVTINSRTLWF